MPDLIMLQAVVRHADFRHLRYPGCHVKELDEFVLISRFPILNSKRISTGKPQWKKSLAAAFTIDWNGRAITVYTVHVPTLRREFDRLTGKKGPQKSKRSRVATFRDDMRARVELNEHFARMLAAEPGPLIVAGDFNMPASGYLHAQYASRLTDAFGVTGRGFGFTFPGFDPYLPTFFGTWLRLDYVFCNSAWKPLSCTVEQGRASQHRAVAATFQLKGTADQAPKQK
jgi:endonuclease/exonuclease/phosphatase (EEP) superfamily protein YafD